MIGIHLSKIMLIDGDEDFDRRLVQAARKLHFQIESRTNIVDIYRNPPIETDILILGYDLGRVTGVQLSQYLERHARARFVILVIQGSLDRLKTKLPACVKAVISKESGNAHILHMMSRLFQCYHST